MGKRAQLAGAEGLIVGPPSPVCARTPLLGFGFRPVWVWARDGGLGSGRRRRRRCTIIIIIIHSTADWLQTTAQVSAPASRRP